MSKYVWLIRHGESQGNLEQRVQGWLDFPLTDLGRRQAEILAERLGQHNAHPQEKTPICELIASPLKRAAETAQAISRALGLPVRFDPRLKEYNFGPINGLVPDEIGTRFPAVQAAWEVNRSWDPLPGEEGEPAFLARVRTAMDEIVYDMAEETAVAIVAHGGSLDACLRSWLGFGNQPPSGNDHGTRRLFAFDNASISLVRVKPHSYRILLLNDTCHLKDHQEESESQFEMRSDETEGRYNDPE